MSILKTYEENLVNENLKLQNEKLRLEIELLKSKVKMKGNK